MSSIVPYVAGMYALACQADDSITFDEFYKLASETAYRSEYTLQRTECRSIGSSILAES